MATIVNDAKSCYDRIIATIALLVSHKFGAPEEFCKTVGETFLTVQSVYAQRWVIQLAHIVMDRRHLYMVSVKGAVGRKYKQTNPSNFKNI